MKWVLKTKSLRVVIGQQTLVYRSIEDAPPELRKAIETTLEGPNTRTIVIANQEAYEQIKKTASEFSPPLRPLGVQRSRWPSSPLGWPTWAIVSTGLLLGLLLSAAWLTLIPSGIP